MSQTKSCLFCCLRPIFICGSFFGLHCFSFQCEHGINKVNIYISWIRILWSTFSLIFFIYQTIELIIYVKFDHDNLLESVTSIADCALSLVCLLIMLHSLLFCVRKKIRFYAGLEYLIRNSTNFGITELFDRKNLYNLKRLVYGSVILILTATILQCCLGNYKKSFIAFGYITIASSTTVDIYVHHIIFQRNNENLQKQFQLRLINKNDFIGVLKKARNFHSFVIESLEIYVFISNIIILIGVLFSIGICTTYIYIFIVYSVFNYNSWDNFGIIYVLIMFVLCCGPMYEIVFVITKLANVENGILSFIYLFPISKLTTVEIREVSTTINSLIIQKPLVKVSNMFTVGTPLLASISGTVITYLLIAIQFHVTLQEEQQSN